jgi:MauM/NapG family ferredoxin protein
VNRRRFIVALISSILFLLPVIFIGTRRKLKNTRTRFLRPPGALPEDEFKKQCIGCYKCATACPNDCIEMAGFEYGEENVHTPVINPRNRGCIQCMICTEVCPTGALQETKKDHISIFDNAKMGLAVVDENLCYSYFGRTCGVCYRACPYQNKALSVGLFEQPTVNPDFCTGCGLCEQACIHMPQAIRIVPISEMNS